MLSRSLKLKRGFAISYDCGIGNRPLLYKTISQQLRETAHKYPTSYAVYSEHEGIRLTYTEFLARAEQMAAGLLSLDYKFEKNARVGVFAPNLVDYYVAQMACSMADLVLVNINPAYRALELKYALNKVECETLLMVSSLKSSNYDEMLKTIAPEIDKHSPGQLNCPELPYLKHIVKIDNKIVNKASISMLDLMAQGTSSAITKVRELEKKIKPEDITNIQFTSGTTGAPKASTLTHFNILNNGWLISERLRYTEKDKICCSVPLYHCFGMVISNMAALCAGSEVLFADESFNAEASLKVISEKKVTSVYGVPTMFIEYIKHIKANPGKYDMSNCRTGVMAGALCPKPLMEQSIQHMNLHELTICYGMTETSPVTFQTKHDDSFERKTGSVGKILAHTECKIVNTETGVVTERGEPGEVLTRGYCVMKGYWGDEKATKSSIDVDGWMHTGDIGVMDEEGYLNIVGRSKDMINRGGENVFPKEIEEFLLGHQEIENVQGFPVEDARLGEEIFCWIKLVPGSKLTKEDIFKHCKANIAHYKVPKYVKFVDSFPITVTGKAQKFKMREIMEQEFKANPQAYELYKVR